jgi:hypothetical protein
MGKSLTDVAKNILMNENANAATLKPKSKYSDAPAKLDGEVEDLGPAVVRPTDVPGSAKAAGKVSKDTSPSSQSRKGAVAAEKPKKQAEIMEEEELDEDEQLDELTGYKRKKITPMKLSDVRNQQASDKYKQMHDLRSSGDKRGADRREKEGDTAARKSNDNYNRMLPKKELGEDVEISEELEDFINEMIEEGYSEDEIAAAIDENFELVSEETEELDEEEEYTVDMSEHVEALFAGEELSEEFKEKALTIFEAAVKQKVEEEIARLEDAYAETLEEQVAQIQEELSENVDNYLNYVVEQWVQDNEVAIESGLRTELTEDFISGLRNLFAENYIDIPEDKISVVEEMAAKVSELEEKLDEEIERNVALNSMINESKKFEILVDACDGLTDTQAEKLKALAEGVEFTTADTYQQKLNVLKESYFKTAVKSDNVLDTVESTTDGKTMISEELSGPMASYVKTLGRIVK